MPMPPEQVGNRILSKAQSVVHAEPVRPRPLGVVKVDLVADAYEQRTQSDREIVAGFHDPRVLRLCERVAGRLDHAVAAR